MTWIAQLTYTARGLTSDDTTALAAALGDALVVYDSDTGRVRSLLFQRALIGCLPWLLKAASKRS